VGCSQVRVVRYENSALEADLLTGMSGSDPYRVC
jgi:hypothetical protein